MHYGYDWMNGYGFGMGILMLVFWIGVILVIAAVVAWLVRGIGAGKGGVQPAMPTALQILEERYARGEIEREEFIQKKKDLQSR